MKKPRKTIATAAKAQNRSPDMIEKTAEEQVAAGRWREAIAAYKALIKLTDSPEARVGLAGAYAGRARELVAKGMPKEALTIWENRAQLLPDLPLELGHLALLLRLGRVAQVVELYIREAARLDAETLAALRSHLAAYHLGADPAVAAGLPADDPILVQGGVASQALDAYCRGDDVTLRTALAGISFRSPYRDLAQILKALQRLPVAPAEAATALDKVGDDSGFARLRHACVLALGVPDSLTEDLAAGGEVTQRFALTLAGWGERRRALWDEVRRMTDQGARTLVHLLHRRRALFGEDWARTQALRLLTSGFPKSAVWVSEGGGRRLSAAERLLVAARHCEDGRDPWAEIVAWADYVDHLIQDGPPEPGSDAAVCIALALRRVDSHRNILAAVSPSSHPDASDRFLAKSVEASLDFDPDHQDTYVRLVGYYLRGKDLKSARRLLDRGLQRFPRDLGLLTAALDVALAGNAFKKAARYARDILALDPINSGARERLVKAHLAHARKQIRSARRDLAAKELDLAADWDPTGRQREQRDLLIGLLELIQDPGRGAVTLKRQIAALGGGMSAALALALECIAVGRPVPAVLKAVGLSRIPVPDQAQLSDVLSRLRACLDGGTNLPEAVRRLLDKPLCKAAHLPLAHAEAEAACDTLRRAGLTEARRAFAHAALKRWPRTPIFVLHAFEARATQLPSYQALMQLEDALEDAQEAGDHRTVHRIGEALDPYVRRGFGPGPFDPYLDDDDDEDDDDAPDLNPFGIDPDDALRAFIEAMGVEQLLKMAGVSAKERARLKAIERDLGRGAVIDIVLTMLRNTLPDFGLGGPSGPRPGPGSPGPGRSRGKAKGRPRRGSGRDDDPEQFDLF